MEQLAALISQRQHSQIPTFTLSGCPHTPIPLLSWQLSTRPLIGTACLELSPVPLHEQIKEFGVGALAGGYNCFQVVPLFLLPGVHVIEDIPTEVAIANKLWVKR